jgi:hypothetical protein
MPTDLMFHYTSLFSQDLHTLEPVLAQTSCMNPEDAELIGLCIAILPRMLKHNPTRAEKFQTDIIPMLETIGMSKWIKGEVTHLGLRLGHRNKAIVDLSSDTEDIDASTNPP